MKKYFIGGLIVALLGSGGVVGYYLWGNDDSSTITVATYNIQNLGRNKDYQVPNAVKIIKQFDLVAIQEVMNYGQGERGKIAIQAIVDSLGTTWAFIISDEPNGTELAAEASDNPPSFEFYAFIWRIDKIELINNSAFLWDEGSNILSDLTDQERQFDREPFIASFKSVEGDLDFTIINFHAAAPRKSWRDDEIERLKVVYEAIQNRNIDQNDVFLCGDFNTPVNKDEWDELESIDSMSHILTENDQTTIDKRTGKLSQNQYDTFWYQANFTEEDIIEGSGQVLSAWNITMDIDPDLILPNEITDEETKKIWYYSQMVSDHLPVIIVLRNDVDTDNF